MLHIHLLMTISGGNALSRPNSILHFLGKAVDVHDVNKQPSSKGRNDYRLLWFTGVAKPLALSAAR
jgi:hypothetical protein